MATDRIRGARWMEIRAEVLRRDGGICRCSECARLGRLRIAHEVDHVVPLHKGGSNDPENLSAINSDCHKDKSARERGHNRRPEIGLDGWPVEN